MANRCLSAMDPLYVCDAVIVNEDDNASVDNQRADVHRRCVVPPSNETATDLNVSDDAGKPPLDNDECLSIDISDFELEDNNASSDEQRNFQRHYEPPALDGEESLPIDISDFEWDTKLDHAQEAENDEIYFRHVGENNTKYYKIRASNVYPCTKCGKTYTVVGSLRRHVASAHDKIKPFVCHLCSKSFARRCTLRRHIEVKHKIFSDCSVDVATKTKADKPMNVDLGADVCKSAPSSNVIGDIGHDSDERDDFVVSKYDCELCDRKYRLSSSLRRHMRNVHEIQLRYRCELCQLAFAEYSMLRSHIETKHENSQVTTSCRRRTRPVNH